MEVNVQADVVSVSTSNPSSTRASARVALVTCSELPELEGDDQLALPALAALGITAVPAVWDDKSVDWSAYDMVVLRSPWDYAARRDEFVAWAKSVPRLMNPADIVEWNTDKRYLAELAAAGVPVTPTTFLAPQEMWLPPSGPGGYVIKPAISAGSQDTGRYGPGDEAAAIAHIGQLQRDGRISMIQPYLDAVDTYGETGLMYLADPASGRLVFSHAIRKDAMLEGPFTGEKALFKPETISARVPSAAELAVAEGVVTALPTRSLLYARIDVIPDAQGDPMLLELELTEPSLFFAISLGAAERYAAAIAGCL